MTQDEITSKLLALQEQIQAQTQAILNTTDVDRKEDLTTVRDELFRQMADLLTAQGQLQSEEAERIQNELQRMNSDNDFRIPRR